ncbi:MAG: glyoxalase/bleomycin resistance/extradiol dioxygenase family protein [Chitinophagaceae bacterium]|nr:glyoxalase/bleomycin resistance/extradiol dioxygenase family protein [Chitinophagaceae bacterium]
MKKLNPYFTFNGNCREAMKFYQKCLGGKLYFQTAGESPVSEKMPAKMKKIVVHALLTSDSFILMASDMTDDQGLIKGNAVSVSISFFSERAFRNCYKKLSYRAQQTYPVQHNFYGILFGSITDRYGNQWLLNCSKERIKAKG